MDKQRLHPLVYGVIIGTFFSRLSSSMSMPFLAVYLTVAKGISPGITGMIIGISALVGVLTGFIGGHLSDRYGRKTIMLASLAVWIAVFCGFAFADSIPAFFICNALNGACKSFFEPSSRALMSDYTRKENKLKVFNLRYTAINIGVVAGPLIGLQLGKSSLTVPFLVTAAIYTLYGLALIMLFARFEQNRSNPGQTAVIKPSSFKQSIGLVGKDMVLLFTLLGMICGNIGYSQFSSTLPQYLASSDAFLDGVKLYGYMMSLNAVTVLILQYPLLHIGKKFSALVSIFCGIALTGFSLFGLSFISHTWSLVVCTIVFTAGEILIFTMTDFFVDEIAPAETKGLYFGALSFTSIGQVIGPSFGGFLLTLLVGTGQSYAFICMGFVTLLGCYFIVQARKKILQIAEVRHEHLSN
ncbi:MDR family MFS transporter [Bacillus testis]|uniref:MDR family MFS transporter n=1 Tax=Bacillus testis TaxID=1622072 RepID=UPI00067F3F6F|nr:MFS transporter [Bacillus testis]